MLLFYSILAILFVLSISPVKSGFNEEYISKSQSNVVKGVFIWLVFLRHIEPYIITCTGFEYTVDAYGCWIGSLFRQLLVAPFLFYSGYGVVLSIRNNKESYGDNLPKKRIFATILNFDVAVIVFIILNTLLGIDMSWKQIVLSFLGWDSVGNSNWYIFAICIFYILTYISYKLCRISSKMILCLCAFLCLYVVVMYMAKGSWRGWWYDTTFAYGAGAIYAWKKEVLERYCMRNYWAVCLLSLLTFFVFYNMPNIFSVSNNVASVIFSFLIVLLTYKVSLKSSILEWCGKHLFPLYIYQRIPMILFATIGGGCLIEYNYYLYIVVSLLITCLISFLYKYFAIKI